MLKPETPAEQKAAAYRALVRGLEKHGKPVEVAKAQAFVDHYKAEADADYRKEAIPFAVGKARAEGQEPPRRPRRTVYDGPRPFLRCRRRGVRRLRGRRIRPPRSSSWLSRPPRRPRCAGESRHASPARVYSGEIVEQVPAALVDGQMVAVAAGRCPLRRRTSRRLRRGSTPRARPRRRRRSPCATRAKGKVAIEAKIMGLSDTGDKVRLRFAVVEEEVRYVGSSGRRFHGCVVRGFLGGAEGIRLDKKDSTHTATLDTVAIRKGCTLT